MRLIESSASDTPLPKIPYDAKISWTSSALDKILGDVQVVSDYLTIASSESSATFSGKGDSGEVDISLESSQDEIQELSVQQESTGTYSLEYLNPIIKAVGNSVDIVTCEFSTSKPLRVEFKVSNLGQIHFYLAPRVES
jgi:proliferating cell nuclear antigen